MSVGGPPWEPPSYWEANRDVWISEAVIFGPLAILLLATLLVQNASREERDEPWWVGLPWLGAVVLVALAPMLLMATPSNFSPKLAGAGLALLVGAAVHVGYTRRARKARSGYVEATGPFVGLLCWSALWTGGLWLVGVGWGVWTP